MKIIERKIMKSKRQIEFDSTLPVTEVAKKLKVSRATVYNWINKLSFPSPKNLKKLQEMGL
jgi:predicted DNA-binding transcriptional regulator AlpA